MPSVRFEEPSGRYLSSPDGEGNRWLRVRRSARTDEAQWRDETDDAERGPAKHRDEGDERWAPLPAGRIADRVAAFAATRPAGALLLAGRRGGRLDMGNWRARVWSPVRDRLYGHQRKLGQLTPHDLRHAAATMQLRAGVSLPVARRWGAWASSSVLLDVYAGVKHSEDSDALAAVRALLKG